MGLRFEEFVERTSAAATTAEVGALLRAELAEDGYENLVFASTLNGALQEVVWADLPDGYAEDYLGRRWDLVDPVLQRAQVSRYPFLWRTVAESDEITAPQRRFLNRCQSIGVHSGLTAPLHGPGGEVDLVSVSRRSLDPAHEARLPHVFGLVMQAWLRRSELVKPARPRAAELSAREIECLKWVRDGKTAWEIGLILSISAKTVEFHLGNAMRKLGAQSRLEAVLIAIRIGSVTL